MHVCTTAGTFNSKKKYIEIVLSFKEAIFFLSKFVMCHMQVRRIGASEVGCVPVGACWEQLEHFKLA